MDGPGGQLPHDRDRTDPGRHGRLPSRRDVLAGFAIAAGAATFAACSDDRDRSADGDPSAEGPTTTAAGAVEPLDAPPLPGVTSDPFGLGISSGDPDATSVVLWTRLAPDPLAPRAGMPEGTFEVVWEVARDDTFETLVATGTEKAEDRFGHSVHAIADGLEPDSRYHYRFRAGEWTSPVGRTRTAPRPDAAVDHLVMATGSCQHWEAGFYTAHRALAGEEDLDLVVWLGDFIYEGGPGGDGVREHDAPEPRTLDEYRHRYALYQTDQDLRAARAAAPWLVIWDDHEVENNYAGLQPENEEESGAFPERRAAAYRSWWENQPVRLDPPRGPDLPTHRDLRWGSLAHLFALDTRQERADQVCALFPGVDAGPVCEDLEDPDQNIIGEEQERWLVDGLKQGDADWNVIANQVVVTPVPVIGENIDEAALADAARAFGIESLPPLDGLRGVLADQWDGYPLQRQRILDAMAEAPAPTVVLTGDIHASGAGPLHAKAGDPSSKVVGAEFVGTSISSDNGGFTGLLDSIFGPAFEYYQGTKRGYLRVEVTPQWTRADYVVVEDAKVPDSPTRVDASFEVAKDGTFTRV